MPVPPSKSSALLPGTLDMMILRTLADGPEHGYGIARSIRARSEEVLQVEEGSLYPALHRLARKGLLRSEWRRSDANRRAKYYRLTPQGRRHLRAETAAWTTLSAAVGRVMGAVRAGRTSAAPEGMP